MSSIAPIVLIFVLVVIFLYPYWKKNLDQYKNFVRAQEKKDKEQIIVLFTPGEKLTVIEIARRLMERTANRKDIAHSYLYNILGALVSEKRLEEEIIQVSPREGIALTKRVYFLPVEVK